LFFGKFSGLQLNWSRFSACSVARLPNAFKQRMISLLTIYSASGFVQRLVQGSGRCIEPQNIQQGILNVEVKTTSAVRYSFFDIRYSIRQKGREIKAR
jgi:hypothetical protein